MPTPQEEARLAFDEADASLRVGDLKEAAARLESALGQQESFRSGPGIAEASLRLAFVRVDQHDFKEGVRLAEAARTTYVRTADRLGEAATLLCLARARLGLNDLEPAIQDADGASQIFRSRSRPLEQAQSLRVAGEALRSAGRLSESTTRFRGILPVLESQGQASFCWSVVQELAKNALRAGAPEDARAELRAGLRFGPEGVTPASPEAESYVNRVLEGLAANLAPNPDVSSPATPSSESQPQAEAADPSRSDQPGRGSSPVGEVLEFGPLRVTGPSNRVSTSDLIGGNVRFDLGYVRLDISLYGASATSGNWSDIRGQRLEQLRADGNGSLALVKGPHGLEVFVNYRVPAREGGRSWEFGRFVGRDGAGWLLRGAMSIADEAVFESQSAGSDTSMQGILQDILGAPEVARADAIFRSVVVDRVPTGLFPNMPVKLR